MRLEPNTVAGLIWGLQNFDAVEFDIRLTADENLAIYHDPNLPDGRIIRKMTSEEIKSEGIPLFSDFILLPEILQLTSEGKSLWIEIKPNCLNRKRIDREIAPKIQNVFKHIINTCSINQKN